MPFRLINGSVKRSPDPTNLYEANFPFTQSKFLLAGPSRGSTPTKRLFLTSKFI